MAAEMQGAMTRFEGVNQTTQQQLQRLLESPPTQAVAADAAMAQAMRGGLEGLAQQLDAGQQAQLAALARGPELLAQIAQRLEQLMPATPPPAQDELGRSLAKQEQLLQGVKSALVALNESLLSLKPHVVAPGENKGGGLDDAALVEAARSLPVMESALQEIRQTLAQRVSEQGSGQQQLLAVLAQLDDNLNRGAAQREALLLARMSQEQGSLSESLQEMLQTGVQTMERSVVTLLADLAKREQTEQAHFQSLQEGQNQLESRLDQLRDQDLYQGQELEAVRDALEGQEETLERLLGLHNDADARLQGVEINQGQHQTSLDNLSSLLHRQESMVSEELGLLKEQAAQRGFWETMQRDQLALASRLDTMHAAQDRTADALGEALQGQQQQLLTQLEGMEDLRQSQQEMRAAQQQGLQRGDVMQQLVESIHLRHADRLARLQRKLANRLHRLEQQLVSANSEALLQGGQQLQQLGEAVDRQVAMMAQLQAEQIQKGDAQQQSAQRLEAMNEEQQSRLQQVVELVQQAQQQARGEGEATERQLQGIAAQLQQAASNEQQRQGELGSQLDRVQGQLQEAVAQLQQGQQQHLEQLAGLAQQITQVAEQTQLGEESVGAQLQGIAERLNQAEQQAQSVAEGVDHHLERIAQQLTQLESRSEGAESALASRMERISTAFAQLRDRVGELAQEQQRLAALDNLDGSVQGLQQGLESQQLVLAALAGGLENIQEHQQEQSEGLVNLHEALGGVVEIQTAMRGYGAQLQGLESQLTQVLEQDPAAQLAGLRSLLEGQPAMLDVLKGGLDRVVAYVEQRQHNQNSQKLALEEGVEGLLGNLQDNLNLQGEVLLQVREHQAETASEYKKLREYQKSISENLAGVADAQRESADAMNLTRSDGLESRRFMESVMDAQQAIRTRMGELGDVQRLLQNALGALESTQDEVRQALHSASSAHDQSQTRMDGVVTELAQRYAEVQQALQGQHALTGVVQESLGEMRAEQGMMQRGVMEAIKTMRSSLPEDLPEVVESLRSSVGQTLRENMQQLQQRVEGIGKGMERAQSAMGLSLNEIRALLQQTGAERDARMAERLESMGEANRNRHQALMNTLEGLSLRLVQRSDQMQNRLESSTKQMLEQLQGGNATPRPADSGVEQAVLEQLVQQQGESQLQAITGLKAHLSDLLHGTMGHFADEVEQRVGQMLQGSLEGLDEVSALLQSQGGEASQWQPIAQQLDLLIEQSRTQNAALLEAVAGLPMAGAVGDGVDASALVPLLQKRMEESLKGTLGELEKLLEESTAQSNARSDQLAQAMEQLSQQREAGSTGAVAEPSSMSPRLEALVADMDGRLTLLQKRMAEEQAAMQHTLEAWAERIVQSKEEEKSQLVDRIASIDAQNESRHQGMMGALNEVSRAFSGDMEQMRRDMEESTDQAADKLVQQLRKVVHGASEEQAVYIEMLGERMDALRKKLVKK